MGAQFDDVGGRASSPAPSPRTSTSAPAATSPVEGPGRWLTLQASAGNRAVAGLLVDPGVVQRHTRTPNAPASLSLPQIVERKRRWSYREFLSDRQLEALRSTIAQRMPKGGRVQPAERVKGLRFQDHWSARSDPNFPKTGLTAAAVVDAGGDGTVHINNSLDDFFLPDGSPDATKIRSTLVHESFHAMSANHAGLQGTENELIAGSALDSPDEAVTDYLAIEAYYAVFGRDAPAYLTAYFPSTGALVGASPDVGDKAKAKQLPGAWTGEMVKDIQDVLGMSEQALVRAYFDHPATFKEKLNQPEVKSRLKARWIATKDAAATRRHGAHTLEAALSRLETFATAEKVQLQAADRPAAVATALTHLRDAGFDLDAKDVERKLDELKVLAPRPAAPAAAAAAPSGGGGGLDLASGIANLRRREAPRFSLADSVAKAQDNLGMRNRRVKVVLIPPAAMLDTPFSGYGAENIHGLEPADAALTLRTVESIAPGQTGSAADYIQNKYGDGGYDHSHRIVFVVLRAANDRTIQHEIGHYHQDVEAGITESDVPSILIEYHNIVLNENLGQKTPRTKYNRQLNLSTFPAHDRAELDTEVRELGANAQAALAELDGKLQDKDLYPPATAATIKDNLLREYFLDQHAAERSRLLAAARRKRGSMTPTEEVRSLARGGWRTT